MLNTLKKAFFLFVILLLTPTVAHAHNFLFELGKYSIYMLFVGLIAGALMSYVRMSKKKGLLSSLGLAIMGIFLYSLVTQNEAFFMTQSTPFYVLVFKYFFSHLFFGLFYGIIPLGIGFLATWSVVDSSRQQADFEIISSTIYSFANDHNLYIEKYHYESFIWYLCFTHPKGGTAKIEIVKKKSIDNKVTICGEWVFYKYDSSTFQFKNSVKRESFIKANEIRILLKDTLLEIVGWGLGEWSKVVTDNKQVLRKYSKEEFEEMQKKYPQPKI